MDKNLDRLTDNLISLGFAPKEAKVYTALLDLGMANVTEITRRAGVSRTNGYNILNSLVIKGLVSISGKEPKQEYAAESPVHIISHLKSQQAKVNTQLGRAQDLVSELSAFHNVKNRPKVRFYEGEAGLKEVYEDTLTSHEDLRSLALVEEAEKTLEGHFPKYYQRRAAKNIAIRAIFPDSPKARDLKRKDKIEKRQSLILPSNEFDLKPEINVYDNKVMIASWREKLGIIIESQEIANALKLLFELAWKEAQRQDVSQTKTNSKQ